MAKAEPPAPVLRFTTSLEPRSYSTKKAIRHEQADTHVWHITAFHMDSMINRLSLQATDVAERYIFFIDRCWIALNQWDNFYLCFQLFFNTMATLCVINAHALGGCLSLAYPVFGWSDYCRSAGRQNFLVIACQCVLVIYPERCLKQELGVVFAHEHA